MARIIDSPGVQINEIDLSFNSSLPVGTNVLVNGFAPQGPTLELINITSKAELEQVYGVPSTEAERYFYHTASEVLNSPANLIVNRLPYGGGSGAGFGDHYTGLFYPVTGANTTTTLSSHTFPNITTVGSSGINTTIPGLSSYSYFEPASLTVSVSSTTNSFYELFISKSDGTLAGTTKSGTINYYTGGLTIAGLAAGTYVVSSNLRKTEYIVASYQNASAFLIGQPTMLALTESEYLNIQSNQITWQTSAKSINPTLTSLGDCGFIILNQAKTTIDEFGQGYYVAITDNKNLNPNMSPQYDSVRKIYTTTDINSAILTTSLNEANLALPLTSVEADNTGSISQFAEAGFTSYDFTNASYNDSLIVNIFRLKTSNTSQEENRLFIGYNEKFIGSLDANDQYRVSPVTYQQQSFYLTNLIDQSSNTVQFIVNPNIANKAKWTSLSGGRIAKMRVVDNTANALGTYASAKQATDSKIIGDVVAKLQKSLMLAENLDAIDIDVVVEGGLGTIFTYAKIANSTSPTTFDPVNQNISDYFDDLADPDTGSNSDAADYYQTVYNVFQNFVQETRKDCIYIADPLRGIFVQGSNYKVADRLDKSFSQNIYWPLKNLYSGGNSNYVCTYGNWVKMYDSTSGNFIWMPYSGYQAAIIARMDANSQPWFAPAGLERGLIRNIVDIAVNPNQKQRDMLYRVGVNPIVFFPRDGYTVFGQKTLQAKPSAFDRINVRRLFLVLERATLRVARYFVMQPNTVFTRTRLVNILKPLFEVAKQNDGIYDYMIICDERNNTPDVIDNNELKVDIYIKPVRTAEFILINFVATRTGQDFNELIR